MRRRLRHPPTVRAATRHLEKVYGAIMAEEGKVAAESYFPKSRAAKGKGKDDNGPAPVPDPED